MAPTKEKKEKPKTKAATPAGSSKVARSQSRKQMQKMLERKQISYERMAKEYDKASPEKKEAIKRMFDEVNALSAAIDEMDVDEMEVDEPEPASAEIGGKVEEPETQPPATGGLIGNGETTSGSKGMENAAVNESSPSTGSSLDNDPSKTPESESAGGNGTNQPLLKERTLNEKGHQQKPKAASAALPQGAVQSIEPSGEESSLFLNDDQTPEFEDPEYGTPLFEIPTASGINEDAVTSVGWSGKRQRQYINLYGKKSAGVYRIENRAYPPTYAETAPESENVGSAENRYGDTLPGTGRFRYPLAQASRIWAVAWKCVGSVDLENDLKAIKPYPGKSFAAHTTRVLVGWMIDGKEVKAWETRSAYRNLIGNKAKADDNIYKAAYESHQRYIEAKEGKRREISRSPSVPLLEEESGRPARLRSKGRSAQRDRELSVSHQFPLSPPRSSVSPQRGTTRRLHDPEKEIFLAAYLDLHRVGDFSELDAAEQQKCVVSWAHHKAYVRTGTDDEDEA